MTTKQAKQKRQNRLGTVLAILIFLLGLGILFYPVASDLWNQHRQNQLISHYTQSTTTLAPEDHSALWEAAQEYNKNLSPTFRDAFTGRQLPAGDPYWGLLDPDGSGIMGYIEIPRIIVRLPIYHGTSEEVLQHGIGHLGGTSLPVGGEGTHAVFSVNIEMADFIHDGEAVNRPNNAQEIYLKELGKESPKKEGVLQTLFQIHSAIFQEKKIINI